MINGRYWNYQEFSENIIEDIRNIMMRRFRGLEVKFGYAEHPDDPNLKVETFHLTGEGKEGMYPEYNLWGWYQQYCYMDNGDIGRTVERMSRQYERDVCEAEKWHLEARIAELDKQVPPKWVTELDTMLECLDDYRREQQKALSAIKQRLDNMGISLDSDVIRSMGREEVMQYVTESRNETMPVPKEEQEEAEYRPSEDVPADMDRETQQIEQETADVNYGEPGRSR